MYPALWCRIVVAVVFCIAPSLVTAQRAGRPVEGFHGLDAWQKGKTDPKNDPFGRHRTDIETDSRIIEQRKASEKLGRLVLLKQLSREYLVERQTGPELSNPTFKPLRWGDSIEPLLAARTIGSDWQASFSAAVVDFLPRTTDEFKKVFETDRVSQKNADEIAAWHADEAASKTTVERFDLNEAFTGTRGVLIFIGHNINGQIIDGAGTKHSLFNLSKQCAIAVKLCIFLSCRAAEYVAPSSPFAPSGRIGSREAVTAMLKIIASFNDARDRLNRRFPTDKQGDAAVVAGFQRRVDALQQALGDVDLIVRSLAPTPLFSLDTTVALNSSQTIVLTVALLVGASCVYVECDAR